MRFRTGDVVYDRDSNGHRGPHKVLGVFWTPAGEMLHLSWRGEPITRLLSNGQRLHVDCPSSRYIKKEGHHG